MSYLITRLVLITTKPSTWPVQGEHLNIHNYLQLSFYLASKISAARLHCVSLVTNILSISNPAA